MRLVLEIRTGFDAGSEIAFEQGGRVRVGRASPSEYVFLHDLALSRQHFVIEWSGDTCWLQDLHSSNGTWVNGHRVDQVSLQEGDEITAGEMTFVVRFVREEAWAAQPTQPASAPRSFLTPPELSVNLSDADLALTILPTKKHAALKLPQPVREERPPEPSPQEKLLGMLREQFQPLYAIVDAARSPEIYKLLAEAKEEARQCRGEPEPGYQGAGFQYPAAAELEDGAYYESLFEGWSKSQLALFSPFLVSLPPKSKLLEKLVTKGWGKSWGIYLTCHTDFAGVRRHFRHFLMVNTPSGEQMYFRFYDPRVLRVFLPACTQEEIASFFGPVSRFVTEDKKPEGLVEFVRQWWGMNANSVPLGPSEAAAA